MEFFIKLKWGIHLRLEKLIHYKEVHCSFGFIKWNEWVDSVSWWMGESRSCVLVALFRATASRSVYLGNCGLGLLADGNQVNQKIKLILHVLEQSNKH